MSKGQPRDNLLEAGQDEVLGDRLLLFFPKVNLSRQVAVFTVLENNYELTLFVERVNRVNDIGVL
jgi:hypothetical protein